MNTILTPIEKRGDIYVKRDDLFSFAGINGGKVRTALVLAEDADWGLVTAGSRFSPQVNIVARLARALDLCCRVHVPAGEETPELRDARRCGAEVIQHTPGYNSVIIARARADVAQTGYRYIPFGMECGEAVEQTAKQVENIPGAVKRIVIPVGSGMSLAGVLHGVSERALGIPVLGIVVGADPGRRLLRYAPFGWTAMIELVESTLGYHERAHETIFRGIKLDPIYEAKCLPYLEADDLFWIVGIRPSAM